MNNKFFETFKKKQQTYGKNCDMKLQFQSFTDTLTERKGWTQKLNTPGEKCKKIIMMCQKQKNQNWKLKRDNKT